MKKYLAFIILITMLLIPSQANAKTLESTSAKLLTVSEVKFEDERTKVLKSYLEQYNSPLSEHAGTFVATADKYSLDWRLVAAISGLESGFGKEIPYNSYNGWGWGIYGDNVIRFSSWDEAIDTISKGIRERYLISGVESDPYIIGPTYAASPTWAVRVASFMYQMKEFEIRNAKDSLSISI